MMMKYMLKKSLKEAPECCNGLHTCRNAQSSGSDYLVRVDLKKNINANLTYIICKKCISSSLL